MRIRSLRHHRRPRWEPNQLLIVQVPVPIDQTSCFAGNRPVSVMRITEIFASGS